MPRASPKGIESGLYHDLADGALESRCSMKLRNSPRIALRLINRGKATRSGAQACDGDVVTTAPGWREAYAQWIERRVEFAVLGAPEFGGMGLPAMLVNAACTEMWNASNMAFAVCARCWVLARSTRSRHSCAANTLKKTYLEKMISGEWSATMNLTEPQAGSDLAALRSRAVPQADGSYRVFGQKIFISIRRARHDGQHCPSCSRPPARCAGGNKSGISLFLVPKFLPDADGKPGVRNDLRCTGIEHKLGIHASPTCSMSFGDTRWRDRLADRRTQSSGLNCMFTMMNSARLSVGLQGVALAERATQHRSGVCARPQAGTRTRCERNRHERHRRSSRHQAHASNHARDDKCVARDLLHDGRRARSRGIGLKIRRQAKIG